MLSEDEDEDETPEADPDRRLPTVRIEDFVVVGDRIDITVRYGRQGDHDTAVSTSGAPDIPLKDRAATKRYKVIVFFPAAGEKAVMIAEIHGRGHQAETLLKLVSVDAAERASKSPIPDRRVLWRRWMPRPITDDARLEDLLREGDAVELTLFRKSQAASGRKSTGDLTLKQNGLPVTQRAKLVDIVRSWAAHEASDKTRAEAAKALSLLVGTSVGALGFNDGEVQFMENGRPQVISPTNLARLFIYPTGESLPTFAQLADAGVARLRKLQAHLGVQIEFGEEEA